MRRSSWTVCVLLAVASAACKKEAPPPQQPDDQAAADMQPAPVDTMAAAVPAETMPVEATPAVTSPPPPSRQAPPPPIAAAVRDVPYISNDTGTVAPGMTEADVVAMWGSPVAVSRIGAMTYLYFPNSCELSCGTLDVVFLENGQVVDAVLRWPGHGYSGQSSSPPGSQPVATPPEPIP